MRLFLCLHSFATSSSKALAVSFPSSVAHLPGTWSIAAPSSPIDLLAGCSVYRPCSGMGDCTIYGNDFTANSGIGHAYYFVGWGDHGSSSTPPVQAEKPATPVGLPTPVGAPFEENCRTYQLMEQNYSDSTTRSYKQEIKKQKSTRRVQGKKKKRSKRKG